MALRLRPKVKRLVILPRDSYFELRYLFIRYQMRNIRLSSSNPEKMAVLIHLYYEEMWPYFSKKIKTLVNESGADLFIDIPRPKSETIKQSILHDYPDACIVFVPNKGRDVLPFLYIAKFLQEKGYRAVLKLHSKKSPQRSDGESWAEEMISDLTPTKIVNIKKISKIMRLKDSALIGPKGNYVPLPTYYNDNHPKILWLISKVLGHDAMKNIDKDKWDYGFFAGTMFWVKLDAIEDLLQMNIRVNNFASESQQLDGTIAHALERVICLLPEYNEKKIYEIDRKDVTQIQYKTDYIPEWSDYYHKKEEAK